MTTIQDQNLRVLFAPDYRAGVPYQAYLAEALREFGITVEFLSSYSRILPLYRGVGRTMPPPHAIHLHWPEAYFHNIGGPLARLRVFRYPLDFGLVAARFPIILTAHNLLPHDRAQELGVFHNIKLTAQRARSIFVHSAYAQEQLCRTFQVDSAKCVIIPHGDQTLEMLPPLQRDSTRRLLNLPASERQKVCLVFGTVSPYKGIDQLIRHWITRRIPHRLAIVGPVNSTRYAAELRKLAAGAAQVDLRLADAWLSNAELRQWLSAVDCVIFNYRDIFTSGAAVHARSFGLPLLIPQRLKAADLGEPHPHVFRFESLEADFASQLAAALATPPDHHLAAPWRESTSWKSVARTTSEVYRSVLTSNSLSVVRRR